MKRPDRGTARPMLYPCGLERIRIRPGASGVSAGGPAYAGAGDEPKAGR